MHVRTTIVATLLASTGLAAAQEPGEERPPKRRKSSAGLAARIQNPINDVINIPFQFNADADAGPNDDAGRYELRLLPILPIQLTRDYFVISRTIVSIEHQDNTNGMRDYSGLGDTLQSFFVTHKEANVLGLEVGAGPILLLPTATSDALGAGKLGIGPTAVVVEQQGGFTIGVLAHHKWSVLGDDNRPDVSSSYVQPFISLTLEKTTLAANTETTYDWEEDAWTIPINVTLNQMTRFGDTLVQLTAGPRWYVAGPTGTADWGIRAGFNVVLPQ